jgi:fructose-bisphosphate aldolase class 1
MTRRQCRGDDLQPATDIIEREGVVNVVTVDMGLAHAERGIAGCVAN